MPILPTDLSTAVVLELVAKFDPATLAAMTEQARAMSQAHPDTRMAWESIAFALDQAAIVASG